MGRYTEGRVKMKELLKKIDGWREKEDGESALSPPPRGGERARNGP